MSTVKTIPLPELGNIESAVLAEESKELYGFMAEFEEHEELLEAARRPPHGCVFTISCGRAG
jgi:hypothetical protein